MFTQVKLSFNTSNENQEHAGFVKEETQLKILTKK